MTIRIIWTIGFLIGAVNHILDIVYNFWLPYEFRPLPWNIYWTSLAFLDPLAALLIWVRERLGLMLGMAIMVSNVLVNGYTLLIGYDELLFPFMMQSAFTAFVFFAAWRHWNAKHPMAGTVSPSSERI